MAEAKARNDGVDARNARDEQQQDAKERPDLVRTRLEEKAKRYDALASGAAGTDKDEPLVDFDRKRAQGLLPPAKELENSTPAQDTNAGSTVWAEFPPPPCLSKPEILPRVPMQPFEKPRSTAEDLDLRERLTAETDLARDTLGNKKRAAREAVRGRLAALRAAREASEASGTEATSI